MNTDLTTATTLDRTEGRAAADALPGCADRLAELLEAIERDGAAGTGLLALAADMAREVRDLVAEILADGIARQSGCIARGFNCGGN